MVAVWLVSWPISLFWQSSLVAVDHHVCRQRSLTCFFFWKSNCPFVCYNWTYKQSQVMFNTAPTQPLLPLLENKKKKLFFYLKFLYTFVSYQLKRKYNLSIINSVSQRLGKQKLPSISEFRPKFKQYKAFFCKYKVL